MKNAKYTLVLGACVTALVVWDCSPTQQGQVKATDAEAMKLVNAYCDRRTEAQKLFEPFPDAGPDAH